MYKSRCCGTRFNISNRYLFVTKKQIIVNHEEILTFCKVLLKCKTNELLKKVLYFAVARFCLTTLCYRANSSIKQLFHYA